MGIEIKVPKRVKIRRLNELNSGLTAGDIAKLTGLPPSEVKDALTRGSKGTAVQK